MAKYAIQKNPDIWVINVTGEITVSEILDIIRTHYPEITSENIIWDLSRATVDTITVENFRTMADMAMKFLKNPNNKKTAYVAAETTMHHLMCIYSAIASMTGMELERSVFKTVAEAEQWCRVPVQH